MKNSKELAKELIGTPYSPAMWVEHAQKAAESRAYYDLEPYPIWAFANWKNEQRGPLPEPMPFVRNAIERGVDWLFGQKIQIVAKDSESVEQKLNDAWLKNKMSLKMKNAARLGAIEGGVALKFSYDETFIGTPLRIQTLSIASQVKVYTHPHDYDQVLMVRVQYRYYVPQENKWYWHREDWTDEEQVMYEPVGVNSLTNIMNTGPLQTFVDTDKDEFKIQSRSANPFGVIPIQIIKNKDFGHPLGHGDFFRTFRVIDRINLAYHLMDKSNQFDTRGKLALIDAMVDQDDADGAQDEDVIAIDSKNAEKQARVEMIERSAAFREPLMAYANELTTQVLEAGGSVAHRPEDITNKGNMTQMVLALVFEPQVRSTEGKRESYGQFGIVPFFEKVCAGLTNIGISGWKLESDLEISWPPMFEYSPEEADLITDTAIKQRSAQLTTHERAIEKVGRADGVRDLNGLKKEIGPYKEPEPTVNGDPSPNGIKPNSNNPA